MVKYFLDTYALIEIIRGNPAYEAYIDKEVMTTILNLYELYYNLLEDYGEEKAGVHFFRFKRVLISFTDEMLFEASKIKLWYKKKRISYVDALGYALAHAYNARFLTGDDAFEHLDNVEFVK